MQHKQKDPLGQALKDFLETGENKNIIIHSDISEEDIIPVSYLFRKHEEMPEIEQKALQLCIGKVLDAGAGAGPHALWLQKQGMQVTAIDTSEGAVESMKTRGIKDAKQLDLKDLKNESFDTILLLMNGIGIAGKLRFVSKFLLHLKSLLTENGQILLESTNIEYMFMEDDGSMWVDANKKYYGEVKYRMEYKGSKGKSFDWLFIDFDNLSKMAEITGLKVELIKKGENHEYLARLTNN